MSMLKELPPLALYVHIPWCERKCPYCDFNSHEQFDERLEMPYVTALLEDLSQQQQAVNNREIISIFIGGGTPSLFSERAIAKLMEGVRQQLTLSADVEITLESNPGSAEAARYKGYRAAGINRLSIGVQSFNDAMLKRLGRIHDGREALRSIDLARAAGFTRYNIDLMHGLPNQTSAQAKQDIDTAISLNGGHLSWYQLTIEPNTAFYNAPPPLPEEPTLTAIQDSGEVILNEAGFSRYEVSAWALSEQASRHNLNYWQFGDYLGIGAGAHGKWTSASGELIRTQRTRLPKDYLAAIEARKPVSARPVESSEFAGEFAMNALRLRGGFSPSLFEARTGLPITTLEAPLASARDMGLVTVTDDLIRATDLGYRFLNDLVALFFDN